MTNPLEITAESLETEKEPEPLELIWLNTRNEDKVKKAISITSNPEKTYAYVSFSSPLPEEMTEEERSKLSKYTAPDGKEYYYCGYGNFDLTQVGKIEPNTLPSLTAQNQLQLKDEKVKPLSINEQEVADVIKNGKVIIYTGAGISVAAGTPELKELESYLRIDRPKAVDDFTRAVMFNPKEVQDKLVKLHKKFFEQPTVAHTALKEIQDVTNIRIVTENLDTLGEAAGQRLIEKWNINKMLPDEELKVVECIVTVGLKEDDSGLLYRFRHLNPNGRIIALNIKSPPYLNKTDYFLEGDAQVVVPSIAKLIRKQV
jgi:NAD-dependent SIR2 family protein deacetylase